MLSVYQCHESSAQYPHVHSAFSFPHWESGSPSVCYSCIYWCVSMLVCPSVHVEVKGQLMVLPSLFYLGGSWGSNFCCQSLASSLLASHSVCIEREGEKKSHPETEGPSFIINSFICLLLLREKYILFLPQCGGSRAEPSFCR